MNWSVFLIFLLACVTAGSTGTLFKPGAWYERLRKPGWTPPNVLFPIAWSLLYIAIAWAAARVAVLPGGAHAMGFWALQIALNTLWTPVFFGLHRIRGGVAVIALLWVAVFCTMVAFWRLDWIAGALILPYLLWVSYAAALNIRIAQLNPDERRAAP